MKKSQACKHCIAGIKDVMPFNACRAEKCPSLASDSDAGFEQVPPAPLVRYFSKSCSAMVVQSVSHCKQLKDKTVMYLCCDTIDQINQMTAGAMHEARRNAQFSVCLGQYLYKSCILEI